MPTIEELQTEIDKLREDHGKRVKELSDEAANARRTLKKYDGIDPDEYKKIKEEAELAALEIEKKAGNFDVILKRERDLYAAELAKRDEDLKSKSSIIEKHMIDDAIRSATAGKAINDGQVLALLRVEYGMTVTDGAVSITKDGAPHLGKGGKPVPISDLVESFLAANPHLVKATGGGSGSVGGPNTGSSDNGDKIMSGLKKLMA